jgi:hypothetical protein
MKTVKELSGIQIFIMAIAAGICVANDEPDPEDL